MRINPATKITSCLAAMLLVFVATGCKQDAGDKITNVAAAANAHPMESGPATAGPEAASEVHDSAQLPSNFPKGFPLPDGFTVTSGTFTPGDAMTHPNFLVQGTSPSSIADIASFYQNRLPEAGYKVQPSLPVTPEMKSALVYFRGNGFKDASIQVSGQDGQAYVLISLPLDE